MTNPLDDYLTEKTKTATDRNTEDLQHWEHWMKNPTPAKLDPLMKRFEPLINQKVRLWKAPNVQESALRAHMMGQAIKAFETYDPARGTNLNTHVGNRLKKSLRFVYRTQNLAAIPEPKTRLIGAINGAREQLKEDLGRDPTHQEIGTHLGITAKMVNNVQKAQMKDVIGSTFESDPVPKASPRSQEVISLLRPTLSLEEQAVFDHVFGYGGKQTITSTNKLADKLGKSPSQVSRLKSSIIDKYNQYL